MTSSISTLVDLWNTKLMIMIIIMNIPITHSELLLIEKCIINTIITQGAQYQQNGNAVL
jgi:hypothetical protein